MNLGGSVERLLMNKESSIDEEDIFDPDQIRFGERDFDELVWNIFLINMRRIFYRF